MKLYEWRAWEEAQRDNAEAADRVVELTHELEERLGSRIASLSKGMRQKVLLTSALLHSYNFV